MPPDTSRKPSPHERLGERRRVGHDLAGVLGERRVHRLAERDRLAGDHVLERSALPAGEHRLVDRLGVLGRGQDAATARAAQRLVGGERDDVGERHRVRVRAAGDETGEVGDVEHEQRTDLVGDLAERLRFEAARVARRADDDHLRTVLEREVAHVVDVDALLGADAVRHEVVEQAAGVDRRAVGEVAAVVEAQAEHRVAGLQQRLVHAHVGVGTGVRLHVGVLGAEQLLGAIDGELLDRVDDGVAAVVALARVALGVLVGEHRTDGTHDGGRREVLAGDQLDAGRLALDLTLDERRDLEVGIGVGWEGHGRTSAVVLAVDGRV